MGSATLTSGRTCTPTPSCPEAPPCTLVLLTACRRRSPPLPPPPSRSGSSLPPRGSTPSGSEAPSWLPSPPSTASASKRTLTLQPSAKRRGKQYTGSNRHHLHLLVSGVIPCFLFNHFSIIWPFGDSTIRLSTTFLLQL